MSATALVDELQSLSSFPPPVEVQHGGSGRARPLGRSTPPPDHVHHRVSGPFPLVGRSTQLIGRDAERGVLEALLDRATRGFSGGLVVSGKTGAGKTALLDHAAVSAVE